MDYGRIMWEQNGEYDTPALFVQSSVNHDFSDPTDKSTVLFSG